MSRGELLTKLAIWLSLAGYTIGVGLLVAGHEARSWFSLQEARLVRPRSSFAAISARAQTGQVFSASST